MIAIWLLLLLAFIGFALLIGAAMLIKRGHAAVVGTILFSIIVVPLFLFWGMAATYQPVAEAPTGVQRTIDGVEQVTNNLTDTLGDLEKELDEFTKPQIDLDEKPETPVTEKESPTEESSGGSKLEGKLLGEPLPAWAADPPESVEGIWQRVVATEPCFTIESLSRTQRKLLQKTLLVYLAEQADSEIPDNFYRSIEGRSDFPRAMFQQHTEQRETSVGEAFISHLLFHIGPSDKEWFVQQWEAWETEQRHANQGMRVAGVGLLSGAVLCGLAMLYGLLRMSEK